MTLKEYLEDYASPETKKVGLDLIRRELNNIINPKVKEVCEDHLEHIAQGERDFRF